MTCRCRDLRRALLGLVRTSECARDASAWAMSFVPEDTVWPPETDFEAMEQASGEDIQAGRARMPGKHKPRITPHLLRDALRLVLTRKSEGGPNG